MYAIQLKLSCTRFSFEAYGACQKVLANFEGKSDIAELGPLSNATAGVMASFFSTFTLCPTELIKCKLQALRETNVRKLAVICVIFCCAFIRHVFTMSLVFYLEQRI